MKRTARRLLILGLMSTGLLTRGDPGSGSDALGPPEVSLPPGVRAVWDLSKAYRETTATRERVCLNGLWRWQPARDNADSVPADRWGYFKVPGFWPGISNYIQEDCQTLHGHPNWKDMDLRSITAAWYQREITVPEGWAGRSITIQAECLNSFALVYVDGKKAAEMRFPSGEADLTKVCHAGGKHVLSLLVVALPLKGVKGATIARLNYKEGIQSVASAEDVRDYYQYVIDQRITLARQKSAMLPILNQTIDGAKVSIFNEGIHTKFPLLGLRLKNTSGKPLTQGPITVYDDGAYAGDTRVLDLQPNEERLLSYAIDQSTEVKTEVKTHPGPDMTFNIGGDNLTAGYTMRQTKTYTVKNRSTHERLVIIEHPIRADWKLVDPKKPADKSRDVYRFQIIVPAGATVKQEVVEDQHRTDPVALTRQPEIAPFYAVFEGIEIKPEITVSKQKLLSLKIVNGVLQAELQQHESKTYFLQNNSERDHTFTVDHVIRKEWKRLSADDKHQTGPALYRFKVDVASKKTGQHEVVEERVHVDPTKVLGKIDEDVLREYLANPAPTAQVKQALQEVLDKSAKLRATKTELAEQQAAMKVLTEDQARVRENLKIVPQTSDVYKDFLKKFVAQEGQIDELQRAIRTSDAQVQKLQKEYDAFVTALTVQ